MSWVKLRCIFNLILQFKCNGVSIIYHVNVNYLDIAS